MKMKITLHGVSYEVDVEILDEGEGFYPGSSTGIPKVIPASPAPALMTSPTSMPHHNVSHAPVQTAGNKIIAPVGGIIVEVKLKAGDKVTKGQEILILEAMKMHTSITSPVDGVIKAITVAAGDTVREGQALVEFAD